MADQTQEKLLDVPVQEPLPKAWDAIRQEPIDSEHQRALEGLPHYWRLDWGWQDYIVFPCGHKRQCPIDWLEDPDGAHDKNIRCAYVDLGLCK